MNDYGTDRKDSTGMSAINDLIEVLQNGLPPAPNFIKRAAVELATLRDQLTQAQAERDALKEANTHGDELLKTAKDLFDGTHELCDEVNSEEWLWKWRVQYYLGETDIPVHEMPQDMK